MAFEPDTIQLFFKVRSTDNDVFDTFDKYDPQDGHSTGHNTEGVYPPDGNTLTAMVLYLLKNKKLTAVMPTDVCSPQNIETLPKHLIPLETFCAVCPGKFTLWNQSRYHRRQRLSRSLA